MYPEILQFIVDQGHEVGPRGLMTKEISPVTLISHNPRKRLFGHPWRNEVSIFTYIEGLWILRGEDTPDRVVSYVKGMKDFINATTGKFDGAYGPQIRRLVRSYIHGEGGIDQLVYAYYTLLGDPESRQAVVIINDPHVHKIPSKDFPCTLSFQFLVRQGKLNMIVHMRSQDAWLGLVYDTGEFQWIQEILAGWLNLDVGDYTHVVASLHLYERDEEKALKVIEHNRGWDLYKDAKILDARLEKSKYGETEKVLAIFEETVRSGGTLAKEVSSILLGFNDFYSNLINIIMAYNLRLKGADDAALMMVEHNPTDLGLIYKRRWLNGKEGNGEK
jgi:hypothetical protein